MSVNSPREPPVVGPGLGRWGRTRRLAPDHDHSTISRPMDWPRRERATTAIPAPAAITRCWPLPPAPASADVPAARGPGQHRPWRRPLPRETVGRVRYGGARGQLTVRADSGFYAHTVVAACREMDVRFSIPSERASLRGPDRGDTRGGLDSHSLLDGRRRRCRRDDLHPVPDQAGRRAGASIYPPHRPAGEAGARFSTGSLRHLQLSRASSDGETLELEADHRRHAEIENAIRDLKYGVGLNHLPSGRFTANGAWLAVQVMAHNLARWTARIGLGQQIVTTKTLRRRVFALVGRITRSARRLTLHLPRRWPWEIQFSRALARLQAIPFPA